MILVDDGDGYETAKADDERDAIARMNAKVEASSRRGLPDWAKDAVYVDTDIHFDWKDRLRIFFRGTVNLRTKTCTENLPGRILTEDVRVHVDRIFPRRRQMMTATVSVPAQDIQNP